MLEDVERVLVDRKAIADRVTETAAMIAADFAETDSLTLVPVLTGSIVFLADLIRQLPMRMQIQMIGVTSYAGPATTSAGARFDSDPTELHRHLHDRDVLIVDDILDSGNTLRLATEQIGKAHPRSIQSCVLLRKRRPEAMATDVDYVCFDVPDQFVVGYGLDFNGHYRNLPDIATLRPEIIETAQWATKNATKSP